MQYVKLGDAGVKVSRLCLGMMSYGTPGWPHHPWVLGEAEAQPFLKSALDHGINFFDTADFYSSGVSEEILGRFVKANMARCDAVIATKVCLEMGEGPNRRGLSRKHILEGVDASLRRLGTDYIDLLYIHRLDPDTGFEEMIEALDHVVRAGKVLYLGASSMWAWQFAKLREMQKAAGLARFAVMQNFYNLAYREEEREMIPYCRAEGVALVPWSPMARGFLAGNRRKGSDPATARGGKDKLAQGYFGSAQDYAILARVEKLAEKLGVRPAQVALAWVLARGITAPIIGATRPQHLDDAAGALDLQLSAGQIAALEAPYKAREVMGAFVSKRLLIVAHVPSPNTRALRDAVLRGARAPDVGDVEVVARTPFEAGADDVLACHGIILGTTENLGYMSGALKDFFDRTYYGVLDKTDALPLAVYVRAGLDGTGTKRAIASITGGLRWKPVQETVIFHGPWQDGFLAEAHDLGLAMAAGLEAGVF